jgi:hypothetical protein
MALFPVTTELCLELGLKVFLCSFVVSFDAYCPTWRGARQARNELRFRPTESRIFHFKVITVAAKLLKLRPTVPFTELGFFVVREPVYSFYSK